MSGIKTAFATIKNAVSGNRKHSHSPSPVDVHSTTYRQGELLDTSDMVKILIIGETGSGKSTFINYLTNYFRQGSLQDIKVAIPSKFRPYVTETFSHCEQDIQNTTQSKTDECIQYMFVFQGKQYLFLDTPGLSDTRGTEQDDRNIVKIINSVEELGGLTAAIVVVNGAVSRLTVNLRNVIARLRGNLPDIIMTNVILILTNSTRHAANFSIQALELNGDIYPYYMQNSAFSQDPSTWTPSVLEALQHDWNQAMAEIEALIQTIDTFKTKSVAAFKLMKEIRSEIKTQMHTARIEVENIQKLQDEIEAFEVALKQSNDDLVTYKDYSTEREVEKVEIVDASFHSTLCQICNYVCHQRCRLDEAIAVGSQIFQRCWAITNGNCRQCPHKCSYTDHYHAKKTVRRSKQKLQDVVMEIKAKYDQATQTQSNCQNKITSATDAKRLLENALLQKNEEIKQLCVQLRDICSGFNIADELHALINQLEVEATILRNIDAKQQANAFIRSLKEFCNNLENDHRLNMNKPSKMNIIDTERSTLNQARLSDNQPTKSIVSIPLQPSNGNILQSSADSGSHANNDVIQLLRAIRKGKENDVKDKTKRTHKKPAPDSNSEVEPDDDDEGRGSVPDSSIPTQIDADEFKKMTINELLDRHHKCNDLRMRNFLVYEMMERKIGKSVGPLNHSNVLAQFVASSQRYSTLGSSELRQEYEKLLSRIEKIIGPDILNIGQVPQILMMDIAAAYIHLRRVVSNDEPSYNNSNLNTQSSSSVTMPTRHDNFYNTQNDQFNSPMNPHQYNFREQRVASGHMNNLPTYNEPTNLSEHSLYKWQQAQKSSQYGRDPPLIPSQPTPFELQQPFNNLNLTTDYHDDHPPTYDRLLPVVHDTHLSSSKIPINQLKNIDARESNEEIRKMSDTELLAAHSDFCLKRNHEKSNILYVELKRRCYGDHPLLLSKQRTLFEQINQLYQNQSLAALSQSQMNVHEKIRLCLEGDDATKINNVPKEYIVEAAVLAQLIPLANSRINSRETN